MDESKVGNEDLYRAAVGESKAHYYLPLFERFNTLGTSLISWNWPSLFVPFFWMLYRRMYGLALAYFILWPISLAILFSVLMVILGEQSGTIACWIVALGVRFVAIPMYANALYYRSVKRRVEKLSADAPSPEAVVQRLIGQRSNVGVVVGVACFAFVAIIGILAAIAIPAYQDYTIRAQVVEGLNLAARVKASVAEAYLASESWPVDLATTGLDAEELRGTYVESIDVSNGAVLIRYGNAAHSSIAGHALTLRPVNLSDGDVQWSCGYAGVADGDALASQTDVPQKYLPSLCRPQVR